MRKSMFAALLVLTILLCGCSDVSTAPTKNENSELVTETEAAAKKESTEIVFSSESEDVENGYIIDELMKGYMYKDKVLKYSKVIVCKK